MKHLLNNLSEEEKNSIREQHAGGIKIITENFGKLIGAKSGDVKPIVEQQTNDNVKVLNDGGVIELFSDVNGKNRVGSTFISIIEKQPNGDIHVYPDTSLMKVGEMYGNKNDYKLLVFSCGKEGFVVKSNSKRIYSKKLQDFLTSKYC